MASAEVFNSLPSNNNNATTADAASPTSSNDGDPLCDNISVDVTDTAAAADELERTNDESVVSVVEPSTVVESPRAESPSPPASPVESSPAPIEPARNAPEEVDDPDLTIQPEDVVAAALGEAHEPAIASPVLLIEDMLKELTAISEKEASPVVLPSEPDILPPEAPDMSEPLESPKETVGSADGVIPNCKICQNKLQSPRVLSCLHVFCEQCIDKVGVDETGDAKQSDAIIRCPLCKQATKVGSKGAVALHHDYILTNILDISSIEPAQLACTSCKSKEMAISRCNDCANFLCASCDNAHQYMRCFEDHTVVRLDEMRRSEEKVSIHKPLYCKLHVGENLKYYCFNCQMPVCNDCLITEHKGGEHHYEIISEAEKKMRGEVEGLMNEAKTKIDFCEHATSNLDSSLQELQSQHDTARDLIKETFQTFLALLERCRDGQLKELEKLHSERELKIMELFHNVEKSVDNIENACGFTRKVLEQGNGPEFLCLKKMISAQFLNLINTIPKVDVHYSIEFETKFDKFETLVQDAFGKLRTEQTPPSPKESTPPPTLPGMPPILVQKNATASNSSQSALTGSVTASSPISLPTSMQSSFDGDISSLGAPFMLPSNVLTPESPSAQAVVGVAAATTAPTATIGSAFMPTASTGGPPNISGSSAAPPLGLSSMAEYNLHRLANIAEATTDIADPIIQPTANPATQFTLADLLSGDQNAFNSLQALAKIGLGGQPDFQTPRNLPNHSPGGAMDNVASLLNDYSAAAGLHPNATSPLLATPTPLPGVMGDDLCLNAFPQQPLVPGRTKATPMQIRCKFGSLGPSKGQFNAPHGFCLGLEEEIIVADTNNHRIEVFEKNGTFKFQFGVPGKDEGQLWYPRKVAVMRTNSKFVVCDRGNERSRMQIFTKNGHFMKKIAIRYIDIVAGLAVTNEGHIVAVDSVSPTVFIISEEGDLLHWFDCSDYMREPSDIAISGNDFYVCDFKGHCVAVFSEDGKFKYRIGNEKVTCFPNGIDISDAGDILIGDSHGNRFHVACYSRDGILQSEFECPHVKVSRCCGLKITSEGYVVTLAKNNHHVLVLNTLYIQ